MPARFKAFLPAVRRCAAGLGLFMAAAARAADGTALWTNVFNGAGNSTNQATCVAVDGSGSVYVTGAATGSGSGQDYATIKYSEAGIGLWTNFFNGTGNDVDKANYVTVDGNGNVYVTGMSISSGAIMTTRPSSIQVRRHRWPFPLLPAAWVLSIKDFVSPSSARLVPTP